jgi:glutamate synthase domain-containing protein 1
MCGIVGLFLKDRRLEPELGRLTAEMIRVLSDRGPDSAGFAVYGPASSGLKLTVRVPSSVDPTELGRQVGQALEVAVPVAIHADHAVLTVPDSLEQAAREALARLAPGARIVGVGSRMELYKAVGEPGAVCDRLGLEQMSGTHAIGHTRMATESAVTTAGAHPFSTGPDQCLVHNGSLSNHNGLRRMLVREGRTFDTENDTEVAAGYLSWRLGQGETLDTALTAALDDLDGFYTFVVGTRTGFGVLRDRVACKPAVMAETRAYVAFGSEYRALVGLPGIEDAHIFEPEPARVYAWNLA